jgi:signal transduction histidine kinase
VLCGETETELRDGVLTKARRERATSQLEEFLRLSRIVDGLSLLAKADAGLIAFSPEPVPLHELVGDVAADAQILALAAEIKVELSSCEEAVVSGEPHRLRQLLLNLADNAVKYNQPHGSVYLSLRRRGNEAEFQIANTGPGIEASALARVFDRFYRGDPAHSSRTEGCGLGLSIAQWIVSSHNGTIAITSVPAKLTTVTVKLPLIKAE